MSPGITQRFFLLSLNLTIAVVIPRATPVEKIMRASHSGQAGWGVSNANAPITINQKDNFTNSASRITSPSSYQYS